LFALIIIVYATVYKRALCVSCMLVAWCVIFRVYARESSSRDEATSRSVATGDPLIVSNFLAGNAFTTLLVHAALLHQSRIGYLIYSRYYRQPYIPIPTVLGSRV
jgi:hypothetical protein